MDRLINLYNTYQHSLSMILERILTELQKENQQMKLKKTRKTACTETYKIPTVIGRGDHFDHIDKFKIQKEKNPTTNNHVKKHARSHT